MSTYLQALPLLSVTFQSGTNEDWLDSVFFHDGSADQRPVDLSNIEFKSQVRSSPDNALVVLDLASNPLDKQGRSVFRDRTLLNGGTTGILSWRVPKARCQFIRPDTYVLDVIGIADGFERRVITGTIQFVRGVTR